MTPPREEVEPGEVEALLAEHTEVVAETSRRLRAVLLEGVPDLQERVRAGWHALTYHHTEAGYVLGVFPRADLVQLVLERGAELPDPHGLLVGAGRQVRALEFRDPEDVDRDVLLTYADLALEAGARRRRGRVGPDRRDGRA